MSLDPTKQTILIEIYPKHIAKDFKINSSGENFLLKEMAAAGEQTAHKTELCWKKGVGSLSILIYFALGDLHK